MQNLRCVACDIEDGDVKIGKISVGGKFMVRFFPIFTAYDSNEYKITSIKCQQCGAKLQVIQTVTAAISLGEDIVSRQLLSMNDLFEIEGLREMIENFISDASNSSHKKISEAFLKKMGKITLDNPRHTALQDITLKIGPVSVNKHFYILFASR